MKLCPKIVFTTLCVGLLSTSMAAAQLQVQENKNLFPLTDYHLDDYAPTNYEPILFRNRLDSCCMWTASADTLLLSRVGGKTFPLLEPVTPGAGDTFNSTDFIFQMGVGPRVSLVAEDIFFGHDIEASYYGIDTFSATKAMIAPTGGMWLNFTDSPIAISEGETATLNYVSRLHSAELNFRRPIWENIRVFAGFRFLQLHEELNSYTSSATLVESNVDNNLYGGQIGLAMAFINRERFSIEGVVKAGVLGNYADLSMYARDRANTSAMLTHTSVMGEVALTGIVRVTSCLSLRGGYQAMWVDGVALAGDQYQTYTSTNPYPYCGGTLFTHGAFAGLELEY
ncbi:MAG: hypothetical protein ACWGMZ_05935 [Thermoguttaceae bacterium]